MAHQLCFAIALLGQTKCRTMATGTTNKSVILGIHSARGGTGDALNFCEELFPLLDARVCDLYPQLYETATEVR